jgi:hypothetical protein
MRSPDREMPHKTNQNKNKTIKYLNKHIHVQKDLRERKKKQPRDKKKIRNDKTIKTNDNSELKQPRLSVIYVGLESYSSSSAAPCVIVRLYQTTMTLRFPPPRELP